MPRSSSMQFGEWKLAEELITAHKEKQDPLF